MTPKRLIEITEHVKRNNRLRVDMSEELLAYVAELEARLLPWAPVSREQPKEVTS